jgi:hypothetical protein
MLVFAFVCMINCLSQGINVLLSSWGWLLAVNRLCKHLDPRHILLVTDFWLWTSVCISFYSAFNKILQLFCNWQRLINNILCVACNTTIWDTWVSKITPWTEWPGFDHSWQKIFLVATSIHSFIHQASILQISGVLLPLSLTSLWGGG